MLKGMTRLLCWVGLHRFGERFSFNSYGPNWERKDVCSRCHRIRITGGAY